MLTNTEEAKLIQLLGQLDQPWSYLVFRAISQRAVLTSVELVILREVLGRVQILLCQRPVDDPDWPGMWHLPGSVIRETDVSYYETFKRVICEELAGIKLSTFDFIDCDLVQTKRGLVNEHVYLCSYHGPDLICGKFFEINHLPANFIKHQMRLIEIAGVRHS
jgi:hypothetical protein